MDIFGRASFLPPHSIGLRDFFGRANPEVQVGADRPTGSDTRGVAVEEASGHQRVPNTVPQHSACKWTRPVQRKWAVFFPTDLWPPVDAAQLSGTHNEIRTVQKKDAAMNRV
jgi:hypothetical protein